MNLTVLFVTRSLDVGGVERQLQMLVEKLLAGGFCCMVYSLESGGHLESWFGDMGVPVFSGGLGRGEVSRAPWKLMAAEWRLLRTVFSVRPSVIHSFLPMVTFMGALSGRLAHVPMVIVSRRAMGTHQDRYPVLRLLDRLANRLSHWITVNSMAVWRDAETRDKADRSKLVLIHNGVDTFPYEAAQSHRERVRRDQGIDEDGSVIISIANLIPYKGHSDLIRAARTVIRRFPDVLFLLVGEDRGIRKHLEEEILRLGMGRSIRFLGRRHDIPALLAASDISVLPSHEEGFSNVILEAMAAGLPVVATDVGGNREAVVDGVTGWLVPPKDPAAMAEKIVDLLCDRGKAKEWGIRGRSRVRELFTIDRMVEAHMALYRAERARARNPLSPRL